MCTEKIRTLSLSGAEKIAFPNKPDRQTYRRTDISTYRVASLLKIMYIKKIEIWRTNILKHFMFFEMNNNKSTQWSFLNCEIKNN